MKKIFITSSLSFLFVFAGLNLCFAASAKNSKKFVQACYDGDFVKVQEFVKNKKENGIDINEEAEIKILVEHNDKIHKISFWHSPLSAACNGGKYKTAEYLIKKGADINKGHPLLFAVEYPKVVKLLIDNGADVNKTSHGDMSPLMKAVGNSDSVKLLIKAGADVNLKDHQGNTALWYAAKYGYGESAQALIKAGAKE